MFERHDPRGLGHEMSSIPICAFGAYAWIARKASSGAPSYLYLFSYVLAGNRGRVRGAAHGDDMYFLFDAWQLVNPAIDLTEEDRPASRLLRSYRMSFAKTGTPQCETGPEWPRYTLESDQLIKLNLVPQVRQDFRKRQLDAQENAWRDRTESLSRSVEDAIRDFAASEL